MKTIAFVVPPLALLVGACATPVAVEGAAGAAYDAGWGVDAVDRHAVGAPSGLRPNVSAGPGDLDEFDETGVLDGFDEFDEFDETGEVDENGVRCAAPPLSAVGAAMLATPGAGARRAKCALWPNKWLYPVDTPPGGPDEGLGALKKAVRDEFMQTQSHFSHSSLSFRHAYGFDELLAEFAEKRGCAEGMPDAKKPLFRFMVGMTSELPDAPLPEDIDAIWDVLASKLVGLCGAPENWPLRLAVRQTFVGYDAGWNHTKLTLRDNVTAIASSVETLQFELGIRLGGAPALEATRWYDEIWLSGHGRPYLCRASDPSLCKQGAPDATAPAPAGYTARNVNVFPLRRGVVANSFNLPSYTYEADDALFAGLHATQRSAFFLNPSLVSESIYDESSSVPLIDQIAARLGAGVDVKFVWGDDGAQAVPPGEWERIETQVRDRVHEQGVPPRRAKIAQCMFHVAHYRPAAGMVRKESHAKFYMLDQGGFYVGSQNMYPSGIVSTLWFVPELDEFGFYVDAKPGVNADLSAAAVEQVVRPAWKASRFDPVEHTLVNCGGLAMPLRLEGASDPPNNYTCASTFDASLDFYDVEHDEVARVAGATACTSGGHQVNLELAGVIGTDRTFHGTIAGTVVGLGSDSTALTGSFVDGALNLSFADLEPVSNLSYRGTVRTVPE
jgi:hypothetical protein